MNYFDILLARKLSGGGGGEIVLEDITITENGVVTAPSGKAYKKITTDVPLPSNAYLLKEVEGLPKDIATFNASALPMPSLKVGIEAVQSGSGDPSPTNIRPITGWSAVDVYRTGKNLFDKSTDVLNGYMTSDGTFKASNSGEKTFYCRVPKGTITMGKPVGTTVLRGVLFNEIPSNNDVGYEVLQYESNGKQTFTTTKDTYYVCYCYNNTGEPNTWQSVLDSIQVELGTQPTTYEAYNGQAYTTTLKDGQGNPLTCYGGQLTNENGVQVLDNTVGCVDLGTLDYGYSVSDTRFYNNSLDYKRPSSASVLANALCSNYKVVKLDNLTDGTVCLYSNGYMYIKDSRYTNVQAFKTAMSGVQLVYELENPQTIPQDNLAIASQDGTNNLWADSGDVLEGSYFKEL